MLRNMGTVHDIQVVEHRGVRYLRFGDGGGWQGALRIHRKNDPVFPYQRAFAACADTLMPNPGSFLSFGVGTGTSLRTVRALHPNVELFGVELDESVLDIAIAHFDAPNHREATYWVGDGLQFIRSVKHHFDCIFMDAYLSNRVYDPILEPEVPEWLKQSLKPDGILVANLIFRFPIRGRMKTFLQAAGRQFPCITALPVGMPGTEQNVLTVFSNQEGIHHRLRETLRKCQSITAFERFVWPKRLKQLMPM
jgi:spermidine synthase